MTVSELNEQVKTLLETSFSLVEVVGEISKFTKNATSGHWYFTIKDEKSAVDCAMFKFANSRLKFLPKTGDKVVITGKVSLYTPSGSYQIIASNLALQGDGELEIAFARLKEKLASEGLFDPAQKKPLPKFPKKIALITSLTSAAYADMKKIAFDKRAFCQIHAYGALMQGENAPFSIINALKIADSKDYDAIIIARGGGSKEDLWCFNDENLARAIFAARTPVISAIGHEIDFSISDFVADHRSPTPTAAMVDLLPDGNELMQNLDSLDRYFNDFINDKIVKSKNLINTLNLELKSKAVGEKIKRSLLNLNALKLKFDNAINLKFTNLKAEIRLKDEILAGRAKFFEITKDLVAVFKDGKLTNLSDLKSGDKVILSSQNTQKQATIE